jgi:hypothetical protein
MHFSSLSYLISYFVRIKYFSYLNRGGGGREAIMPAFMVLMLFKVCVSWQVSYKIRGVKWTSSC